jgi:hypothetical protein
MDIQTTLNLTLISKLLRKCKKLANKKVIGKKVCKIGFCPLLTTHLHKVLANNFFGALFSNYFGFLWKSTKVLRIFDTQI